MRNSLLIAALLVAGAASSAEAREGWLTDFEKAKAVAKKEGKTILADFTGSDW